MIKNKNLGKKYNLSKQSHVNFWMENYNKWYKISPGRIKNYIGNVREKVSKLKDRSIGLYSTKNRWKNIFKYQPWSIAKELLLNHTSHTSKT